MPPRSHPHRSTDSATARAATPRLQRRSEITHLRGGIAPKVDSKPDDGGGNSPRLTKLLVHVTIERSLGPVHVVTAPEKTVRDLIKAALEIYSREKRRPLLSADDPGSFQLHYSQFSLESLSVEEKLMNLGSRNFFLCSRPSSSSSAGAVRMLNSPSCSEQAKKTFYSMFPLTKLMDLLL